MFDRPCAVSSSFITRMNSIHHFFDVVFIARKVGESTVARELAKRASFTAVHCGASAQSQCLVNHFWHVSPVVGQILQLLSSPIGNMNFPKKTQQNITTERMPQTVEQRWRGSWRTHPWRRNYHLLRLDLWVPPNPPNSNRQNLAGQNLTGSWYDVADFDWYLIHCRINWQRYGLSETWFRLDLLYNYIVNEVSDNL